MSVCLNKISYSKPYGQTEVKPKTDFNIRYLRQNTNKQNVGFSSKGDIGINAALGATAIFGIACSIFMFKMLDNIYSNYKFIKKLTPEQNTMQKIAKQTGNKIIINNSTTAKLEEACRKLGKLHK